MIDIKIILSSTTIPEEILKSGIDLIKAYFSGSEVEVNCEQETDVISRQSRNDEEGFWVKIRVEAPLGIKTQIDLSWTLLDMSNDAQEVKYLHINLTYQEIESILAQPAINREIEPKLLLKHGIHKLLSQISNRRLPWGILTGIRPGKIIHRLYDLGFSREERSAVLKKRYALRPDKVELLQGIASIQRLYIEELRRNPRRIAVYIGIPFCPTRCTYCSFPSYHLSKERQEIALYLKTLQAEIREVGMLMNESSLVMDSLYIGGGTPTILTPQEMTRLLIEIKNWFPWQECREFTVEAGRADTLSGEMLEVLQEYGVSRLSINPQTMQESTLVRIKRGHSVAEVKRVYELARKLSDWVINMDLILGLPGESLKDVQNTLNQLTKLQPDNLTVHMLALKRGSREFEMGYKHNVASEMEQMQELTAKVADSWGLKPYYLYRQKRMAGNLENIGYAQPGHECVYNISIIEECQNIFGLGAGASTKIIDPCNNKLFNLHHPVSWQHYVQKWQEGHHKRTKVMEMQGCGIKR
ncbi:MAG: coproporphyrinogen dehydrogenase HemZ [Desulfitobacteriaceae bacterium]